MPQRAIMANPRIFRSRHRAIALPCTQPTGAIPAFQDFLCLLKWCKRRRCLRGCAGRCIRHGTTVFSSSHLFSAMNDRTLAPPFSNDRTGEIHPYRENICRQGRHRAVERRHGQRSSHSSVLHTDLNRDGSGLRLSERQESSQ